MKGLVGRAAVRGVDLASQATLSRFENAASGRELVGMMRELEDYAVERLAARRPHDYFDRLTRTTNALGHYEELVYSPAGNVLERQSRQGGGTPVLLAHRKNRYDEMGRLWKEEDALFGGSTAWCAQITVLALGAMTPREVTLPLERIASSLGPKRPGRSFPRRSFTPQRTWGPHGRRRDCRADPDKDSGADRVP